VGPFAALFGLYATARVIGSWGWGEWAQIGTPMQMRLSVDTAALMSSTSAAALKILFWPSDLCPWYEGRIAVPSSAWLAAGSLAIGLAGSIYAAWRLRRRSPAVSLGLAWITGIVALIALRAAADPAPMNPLSVRWLYPAVLGFALMVGGVMQHVEARRPLAARLLVLCVIALYAGANWRAQSLWRDDLSVLGGAFQCSPHSPLITLQYATLLERAGHAEEAEQLRARLIHEQPGHPLVLWQRLGDAIGHGDHEQALTLARQLVAAKPSFSAVRKLADLENLTGRQDDAITHYHHALDMKPDDSLALTALGSLYERRLQWRKAADLYHHYLPRHPTEANIWFRYGRALEASGRPAEAEASFERVIELDRFCPDGPLAVARLQEQRGAFSAAEATRQRYADTTHQPLQPRPVADATDSPCGMEVKSAGVIGGAQTPPASP